MFKHYKSNTSQPIIEKLSPLTVDKLNLLSTAHTFPSTHSDLQNAALSQQQNITAIKMLGSFLFNQQESSQINVQDTMQTGIQKHKHSMKSKHRTYENLLNHKQRQISSRDTLKNNGFVKKELFGQKKAKQMQEQLKINKIKQQLIFQNKNAQNSMTASIKNQTQKDNKLNKTTYKTNSNFNKERAVREKILDRRIQQQISINKSLSMTKIYKKQNSLLIASASVQKFYGAIKNKNKKYTQKQIKFAFENVERRGKELLERTEGKIQELRQQKYKKQMQGVTFHPHLTSSQQLRNKTKQSFKERLVKDQEIRQLNKSKTIFQELKGLGFVPKLKHNEQTQSRIYSIRPEDRKYVKKRYPVGQFQNSFCEYLELQQSEQSLKQSRASLEPGGLTMSAHELHFLLH